MDAARAEGVELVGPGGLLTGLTKTVLETALEAEMSEHLGYDKHDPAGALSGELAQRHPLKTVLTEIGPVEIEVPRDRDGSFEPVDRAQAATPPGRDRRDRAVADRARA